MAELRTRPAVADPPGMPGLATTYAMALIVLTYVVHTIDRQILAVLLEPIRHELGLSDTSLGFLTGFSFAAFYATVGVPIALLADRYSRRNVIAICLVAFSAMTVVCGMVQNFLQLALARIGVGVGESGTSPASHSMVADLFPPERRAGAMGVYALGNSVGVMTAFLAGGWIGEAFGWRVAFFAIGAPGLLLAALIFLTLKEPRRGEVEGLKADDGPTPSLWRSFRTLWAIRSYRQIVIAVSVAVFAYHGLSSWAASFLVRSFQMSLGEVGAMLGLIIGLGGGLGTLLTGLFTDRLGGRDIRWNMWLLCLIQVFCFPFAVAVYLAPTQTLALAAFFVPAFFGIAYIPATISMTQTLAPLRMRAVASSLYLLVVNFLGQGFGPQVIGVLSDLYRPALGEESLRYAMLSVTAAWLWSAVHFWLAAKNLKSDVERSRRLNAGEL